MVAQWLHLWNEMSGCIEYLYTKDVPFPPGRGWQYTLSQWRWWWVNLYSAIVVHVLGFLFAFLGVVWLFSLFLCCLFSYMVPIIMMLEHFFKFWSVHIKIYVYLSPPVSGDGASDGWLAGLCCWCLKRRLKEESALHFALKVPMFVIILLRASHMSFTLESDSFVVPVECSCHGRPWSCRIFQTVWARPMKGFEDEVQKL